MTSPRRFFEQVQRDIAAARADGLSDLRLVGALVADGMDPSAAMLLVDGMVPPIPDADGRLWRIATDWETVECPVCAAALPFGDDAAPSCGGCGTTWAGWVSDGS